MTQGKYWIWLLCFSYSGYTIISFDISLTGSKEYILSNDDFTLTCSSSRTPRGESALFLKDNTPVINLRYTSTLHMCYGIPQHGESSPFLCETRCNCSSDAKTYMWTYNGLITNKSVTFKCEMDFGTLSRNTSFTQLSIDKAYRPASVFLKPSRSIIYVNESDLVGPIQCTADCVPNCTYRWSGPGLAGDVSVLDIENIQRNRNGTYICTAENIYGRKQVEISIIVQFGPGHIGIYPSRESYNVGENDAVGPIKCTSICYPQCTHIWTGPGIVPTINSFHLTNINRNNAGQFTCTASNIVRSQQIQIRITVEYGPASVSLIPTLSMITVNESDIVGPIHCAADCVPNCTYKWSGPGIVGDISVLNIANIPRNRKGTFKCTAENIHASRHTDIRIVVQFGPDRIDVSPSNEFYTIEENNNVGPIDCTSVCYPLCSHEWKGPGIVPTANSIYLSPIKRNNAGHFTCTAHNIVGSMQKEIRIAVEYGPSSVSLEPIKSMITVNESDQVGPINCTADCVPNCTYIWSGPGITNEMSTLKLTDIQRNRSGNYTCIARNAYGSKTEDIRIIVQFKPYLDHSKPNSPTHIGAIQRGNLVLTASVNAYPAPLVRWTFRTEDESIPCKTSTITANSTKTGLHTSSSILIDYVNKENFGEYSFSAINSIGELVRTFVVMEQGKPMPPVCMYVVCKSSTVVLIWKPGFNGGLLQDFYVHYVETGRNMTSKKIRENNTKQAMVYTLAALKPDRKYTFSIQAVNLLGESSSHTKDCITDSYSNNVSEGTGMLTAGIVTLVVGLFIFIATTVFVVRRGDSSDCGSLYNGRSYIQMLF